MKTIWKGSLSFGLVSIPVELYTAVQEHSLGFKLLHAKCNTPINYQRVCPHCKKVVAWHEIVKGLELSDGNYFIITPENIKKLKPEKTDVIDIIEFVDATAVEPIYFEHHYYIVPTKVTEKAYFLFIKALASLNKIAIGKFVMRDKEYVSAIQPYHHGLLLTTLNYDYEIRPLHKLQELKSLPKFSADELALAKELIQKLSKKTFDMSKFKDTFFEKIKKELSKKTTKKVRKKVAKPVKKEKVMPEFSLLESLRSSLNGAPQRRARA